MAQKSNLEWTQIHRTLRPFRSKLQAFNRITNLPSGAVAQSSPDINDAPILLPAIEKQYSVADPVLTEDGFKRPTKRYKRNHSGKNALVSSNIFQKQKKLALKYSKLSSPVRAHVLYLSSIFKESMQKYAPNLSTQRSKINSLSELCSFVIGDHIENADEEGAQEEIYESIPSHFRSSILVQHIVRLCIDHMSSAHDSLLELLDICFEEGAHYQATSLIEAMLSFRKLPNCDSLLWLYSVGRKINRSSALVKSLISSLNVYKCLQNGLIQFCNSIPSCTHSYWISQAVLSLLCNLDIEVKKDKLMAWSSVFVSRCLIAADSKELNKRELMKDIKGFMGSDKIRKTDSALFGFSLALYYLDDSPCDYVSGIIKSFTQISSSSASFIIFCFQSQERLIKLLQKLEKDDFSVLAWKILKSFLKSSSNNENDDNLELIDLELLLQSKLKSSYELNHVLTESENDVWVSDELDREVLFSGPLQSEGAFIKTPAPKQNQLVEVPLSDCLFDANDSASVPMSDSIDNLFMSPLERKIIKPKRIRTVLASPSSGFLDF